MWLETQWTGGSCLLWPPSRCKEDILMYEEHAFPAQRRMGFIKIPSVVVFGVGSLTWMTYKLIWLLYSGTSAPESVNTAAVKDKSHLLHWAFITSLLLYSECFCNLHNLKFPFITKPHISLNFVSSLVTSSHWGEDLVGFCNPFRESSPKSRVRGSCVLKWWSCSEAAATSSSACLNSCLSSAMQKGLINSSAVHCMAALKPFQGEESCAAHLKNSHSSDLVLA